MHAHTNGTLFNRHFIAIAAINLCVMVAYYLLFVISSPYAAERFKTSPSVGGLVAGVMILGCLAGRFVTGGALERAPLRRLLFLGLGLYTASTALYLAPHSLPLLIIYRFLGGIGVGCVGTVTGTQIARIVPPDKLGQGISYFSLSTLLALAVGPFLGIFLTRTASYDTLFLLCLAAGPLSFLIALSLSPSCGMQPGSRSEEPAQEETEQTRQAGGNAAENLSSRLEQYIEYRAVPLAVVVLVVSLCYACVQTFMSAHAREIELVAAASLFFLVYAAVAFCSRPFTGRLLDTRGEDIIMYPALLLTACSLLLLGVAEASWELLLAGALLGAGFGNFQSTAQAVSVKKVPRRRFGQATSTFFIFLDCGIGLGPYLLGTIVPAAGYRGLYMLTAGIVLAAVPLYYFLHGRENRKGGRV